MISVKGRFVNGVAQPEDLVDGQPDGAAVIITFLETSTVGLAEPSPIEAGYAALTRLIEQCQVDSGRSDLAHQHDHHLYGTPERP